MSKGVRKIQGEKWPMSNMLWRDGGHWIIFQKNKYDLFFEGSGNDILQNRTLFCKAQEEGVILLLFWAWE